MQENVENVIFNKKMLNLLHNKAMQRNMQTGRQQTVGNCFCLGFANQDPRLDLTDEMIFTLWQLAVRVVSSSLLV